MPDANQRNLGFLVLALLLVVGLTVLLVRNYSRPRLPAPEPAPVDAAAYQLQLGKAYSLLDAGKFEEARKVLRELYRRNGRNPEVLQLLGRAYYADQRYEEAEKIFRKLVERNEFDAMALNNLGQVLAKLREYSRALVYLERARELNPNSPQILLNLSDVYLALERKTEAQECFHRARELLNYRLGPGPGPDSTPGEQP